MRPGPCVDSKKFDTANATTSTGHDPAAMRALCAKFNSHQVAEEKPVCHAAQLIERIVRQAVKTVCD